MKVFKNDTLHPLLQQMFKIACFCVNTSRETLSAFVTRLIANSLCLLYARENALRHCNSCSFKLLNIIQSGLLLSFCCKLFHQSDSCKIFKLNTDFNKN